jgi:FkbM family methyltransferase
VTNCSSTFVDCGAFDGSEIGRFFDLVDDPTSTAIAMEPDPISCNALLRRIEELNVSDRVVIHPSAVGSQRGMLQFDASGTVCSTISDGGSIYVPCERLDDLLEGKKPTRIKMDVEGAEMSALEGAIQTIRTQAPALSICLYHRATDLWQIPLFVKKLRPDYKLILRAHSEECWELVLYAIPDQRYLKR